MTYRTEYEVIQRELARGPERGFPWRLAAGVGLWAGLIAGAYVLAWIVWRVG